MLTRSRSMIRRSRVGLTSTWALLLLVVVRSPPPAPGYSCVGHCGRWAEHCWCNDECAAHGDCCADYPTACGGGRGSHTVTTRYVLVGRHNRSYELQTPRSSISSGSSKSHAALPVILSFHGDGGTAAAQAADDHYRDVAGAVAIVVHGQGIGIEQKSGRSHPTWNGGGSSMQSIGPSPHRIAPDGETCEQNITKGTLMVSCAEETGSNDGDTCWWSNCLDDVAYVVAILDQLEAEFSVDTDKIFGSGDSNGAMFLYQLIADPRTGGRFSAVAPVAGLPHNGCGWLRSNSHSSVCPPPTDSIIVQCCTLSALCAQVFVPTNQPQPSLLEHLGHKRHLYSSAVPRWRPEREEWARLLWLVLLLH